MIALLRWGLVRAVWVMASCTFLAAAYLYTTPRFY